MSFVAYTSHVLGWTLVHLLWQGALIAIALACTLTLLRKSSARYAASCLSLAAMVVALATTFYRVAVRTNADAANGLAQSTITIDVRADATALKSLPWIDELHRAIEPSLPALILLWSAGFLFCTVRLQLGLLATQRIRAAATEVLGPEQQIFHSLLQRMRVTQTARLLRSAAAQGPAVLGWLKPVVLVPAGVFTGLSPQQVEAVLAHELAHIRRHDYLVSVLQQIVESLLFYHPAVWWIGHQIRKERELCCDEIAVATTGDAVAYARALYLLAEQSFASNAVTLNATGGFLSMRIQRLLNRTETPAVRPSIALSAFALVVSAAAAGFGTAHARTISAKLPAVLLKAISLPPSIATLPVNTSLMVAKMDAPAPLELQPVTALVGAPAKDNKPMQVKPEAMEGNLIKKTMPEYPASARSAHIEGVVVLKAVINRQGTVSSLQAVDGRNELRQSAMDAVKLWTYKPYLLNGQPMEVETTIHVHYSLSDPSANLTPCMTGSVECVMPSLISCCPPTVS